MRERQDLLLPGRMLAKDLCLPFYIGRSCKKDRNVSFLPVERMLLGNASTVALDSFCVKNTYKLFMLEVDPYTIQNFGRLVYCTTLLNMNKEK